MSQHLANFGLHAFVTQQVLVGQPVFERQYISLCQHISTLVSLLATGDGHDVIDYFQQRTNILPGFLSPLSSKVQRVQRGPLQTGALQGDPTDSNGRSSSQADHFSKIHKIFDNAKH